jgi:hypothetical protein
MALLAATTLGIDAGDTFRAEVTADEDLVESRDYRLVVQSYDAEIGHVPGDRARPLGSMQRAVTGAELRKGVSVSLVELRRGSVASAADVKGKEPVVVAWVEDGKPDLEFDGRMARPRPGSTYGVVKRSARHGHVQVRLNRKIAA